MRGSIIHTCIHTHIHLSDNAGKLRQLIRADVDLQILAKVNTIK